MISVAKQFTFHAAHRDARAEDQCGGLHGHTYRLEVVVTGRVLDGYMLIHGDVLKDIYRRRVEPYVEHRNLNETLGVNPTMEAVTRWLWRQYTEELEGVTPVLTVRVKLWETPTMYAEYPALI